MTSTSTLVASATATPTLKSFSQAQQRFNTCIKFIPQAYNTNKCQQCFNLKETHSLEALAEFSKSNRKLLKFGYLFIAPPDLELNKTKRWQWRFFLFYDDGELTYSLDDNPLTVPQGRINMRNCDEIIELISTSTSSAHSNDSSTSPISYPNCLRLKFNNNSKDIYIAAGNYEEIIKWRDVLMLNSKQIVLTEKQQNTKLIKEQVSKQETEDDEYQGNVEDGGDDTDLDDDDYEYNEFTNRTNTNATNLKLKMIQKQKQQQQKAVNTIKKCDDNLSNTNASLDQQQKQQQQQQQQDDTDDGQSTRRLSYKEDDLLRKQRLKENLNQLLIEYKHEEEAQLKKSSRFSINNSTSAPPPKLNNRISLDSCYPPPSTTNKLTHKTSAFSLVVPPQQQQPQQQQQTSQSKQQMPNPNSAFRPVTNSSTNKTHEAQRVQTVDLVKKGCTSASSSEASSWSSSSSSSSSSNSPPKTRQSNLISINTQEQANYKKPCLISPRKQETKLDDGYASLLASNPGLMLPSPNSNKTLTIKVRNESLDQQTQLVSPVKETQQQNIEIIDLTSTNSNKTRRLNTKQTSYTNLAGYLWKTKDCLMINPNKSASDNQFERYWFSLNTSLCCLIYWNDKLEQDLGKFPIGKYELAKCCQLYQQHQQSEFKLTFHQNTVSLHLRANTLESTLNWYEAIKHTIDNVSSFCSKCKPKLVVNPMPLSVGHSQSMSPSSTNQSVLNSVQTQPPPLPTSQPPQSIKLIQQDNELEQLKQKYDLIFKENTDLSAKFKLLEQIHLEAIAEYDNQQSQMFNQLDDMQLKLNKNEQEIDQLNKRLSQSTKQNESNLLQIKQLNEQIQKQKEQLHLKEKEIEKLSVNNTDLDQFDSINESYSQTQQQQQTRTNWNKEVKNLDARISDVLGKLKERELNLSTTSSSNLLIASSPNDDYKIKYEKVQQQLVETQQKLLQLKSSSQSNTSTTTTTTSGTDFSDDLAKVLMSKEEVITQLEKHLKEKEKQIQALTNQLNEEIQQTCKYQDAFNLEQSRTNELNLELKNLNSEQSACTDELDNMRDQLNKTTSLVDSMQLKLDQTQAEKEQIELDLKNLNEFSRNEIETLQEEIKTLEYKLVHSQRQAQEYQNILEEVDAANTSLLNYLLNELNMTNLNVNESSIQSKLKKNQTNISNLLPQVMKKKAMEQDELNQQMNVLTKELNELKEENVDLNDHIYSIDVFMREKDQQCDQLQRENHDLLEKIKQLDDEANQLDAYGSFITRLKHLLMSRTRNLNDFLRFIVSMCLQMVDLFKLDSNTSMQIDEELIRDKLNEQFIIEFLAQMFPCSDELNDSESTLMLINDLNELGKLVSNETNLAEVKESISELVKFINSQDLMQFNCQIVTYMAEQLVHKSTLNGNLKFACDFLRKKLHSSTHEQVESNETASILSTTSEQDEKIFKLASELLLSDEQQLRKLSSHVLNEAQHMQQLNWVLNTLRKLRWKHLKLKSKERLEHVLTNLKKLDDEHEVSYQEEDSLGEDSVNGKQASLDNQLNLILDVIREVFAQHKCQVDEQLNEMKKLMSITPDNDDLVVHLQSENALLQQELTDLKNKKVISSSNWLTSTSNSTMSGANSSSGTSQLRKFSTSYTTKSP